MSKIDTIHRMFRNNNQTVALCRDTFLQEAHELGYLVKDGFVVIDLQKPIIAKGTLNCTDNNLEYVIFKVGFK